MYLPFIFVFGKKEKENNENYRIEWSKLRSY